MPIPILSLRFMALLAVFMFVAAPALYGDDGPRISPEQLKEKLGQPGVSLLDVRIVSDWKKSDRKIVGALRVDPHDVSSWAKNIPKDSLVVVYCS